MDAEDDAVLDTGLERSTHVHLDWIGALIGLVVLAVADELAIDPYPRLALNGWCVEDHSATLGRCGNVYVQVIPGSATVRVALGVAVAVDVERLRGRQRLPVCVVEFRLEPPGKPAVVTRVQGEAGLLRKDLNQVAGLARREVGELLVVVAAGD